MATKQATYLKDYKSPEFNISLAKLDINLANDVTTVTANLSITGDGQTPLVLMGEELVLKSVSIDGKAITDYTCDSKTLTIPQVPDSFILETIVEIKPQENTALSGLYKSSNMYCTQCEAQGFRKITYYLDRPDVMAEFIVTIHADKKECPVLLANGNLIDQGTEGATRHYATWQDPFKKPCYLFAMVAGDLVALEDHFVTKSNRLVTLKLFIERENIEQSSYALEALKKAMHWDEEAYGREYDLDIYMIVAVNDFNMGAMENKGLNIFNSKYVLVSPTTATDADYEGVDMVVGHEYFHNWSGNRVTCRDWFQLSLKEGFTVFREQQFTQDITQSPVARIENVKMLMTRQFAEDAGPLAHPVRPESYMEINNFYTMTIYEKGSEVIRMMHTLLGPEKFRAGTDLYFAKNDGKAVTTDDFVAALQEASGVDLEQFKLWYSQAGTPVVTVEEKYDAKTKNYILTLKQVIPATPGQENKKPMHIPISLGLLDEQGNDIPITDSVISLKDPEQQFEFTNINSKPRLSILRGFSAPVNIKQQQSLDDLAFLFAHDNDSLNRWFAGQQLYQAVIFDITKKDILLKSFKEILTDNSLNLSMKAELLKLPTFARLIDISQPADPDVIHEARQTVAREIAQNLHKDIIGIYHDNHISGPYKYSAIDAAKRRIKNLMLGYLVTTKEEDAIALAIEQYKTANNMTDAISALAAIANVDCPQRTELLEEFYEKWADNPLVVNKWLSIQATADLPGVLTNIQRLTKHPAFDIKNPNKVYSLVGGFCGANQKYFHQKDGTGYKFLTDTVITLNRMNPQVAARMLTPLTEWQKFTDDRQQLMRNELQRIQGTSDLSADVYEIVSKALCE